MPAKNITGFRLSPQQKHLWLLQQVAPQLPQTTRCVCIIDGNLDVALLKRALQYVVGQHEILRTSFLCLPEMNIPVQVIDDDYAFSLIEHDLSVLPAGEIESRIELLYEEISNSNGDSMRAMKLNVSLLRLSELQHTLMFSLPTLCADQRTLKNFVRAVSRQYAAYLNGGESSATPLQYLVASEWLNELLESEDGEAGKDYWRKKDFSTSFDLELPFEPERSAKSGYQAFESVIDHESCDSINALTSRYEIAVPTFLLACWQTLLWRLTQQPLITVATAFDGRTDEELNETLGLLAKHLPIQIQFEKELRFNEVLALVHAVTEEAYAWQECFSWSQVTNSHEKSPGLSFAPICFEFDELINRYAAPDVVFAIDRQESFIDNFKIKLSCVAKQDRIITNLYFDASAFALADIRRLSDRFHTLLASALQNPEEEISRLKILSRAEREQVLLGFNWTTVDFGVEENLHELIEQQAARSGEAVAVVFEGTRLTYAELDRRANQLAHYLRAQGVSVDDIVGVLMERSVEMVVALLGILKAGAAYLPLDPSYPPERLSFMLADAGLHFIISHQAVEAMLPALRPDTSAINVLSLDAEWATVAAQPTTAPRVHTAPENLAYVLYTSGSTGQPKGVMISQGAICNHMLWMQQRFPLKATDAVLQKTPFSFDASVWEFYAPLMAGARLVMALPDGHQDAAYLVAVMEREGVTRVQGVPTLLRMLVSEGGLDRCTQLREVFSGGEVLRRELAESLLQAHSELKLYNLYGPTEATIDATYQEAEWDRVWSGEEVSIGQPIANMQMYVLDTEMQVVPVGVVGELYIGGAGLARGYLNRVELTAQKFVPHPYSEEPGARLYRTGDMVQWQEGGELAYVGRVDAQVKMRGFRVELGEIEARLNQHPSVKECAVSVFEHGPGDKRLVAYVAGRDDGAFDSNKLRSFLKDNLPDYMVPSVFFRLEKMPLMPNGKIDRRALPPIDPLHFNLDSNYLAPHTPTEEILAGMWSELLGVERVSLNDNFFELGGHSLLATQLVTRVRDTFGQEIPLRTLFETPTLAELAQTIELAQQAGQVSEAPPMKRISRDGDLLLSFAQQRLWFLQQLEPGNAFYNTPGAVRLEGTLRVDLLERTFAEMVRRHEILRTTFKLLEGQPVQIIGEPVAQSLPLIDLSHLPASERDAETKRCAEAEAARPFDLERGPLVRMQLLRLAPEEHVLLVTMHHIVSDGWSIGILLRELDAIYAAYLHSEESPLVELPIQYADFAHWQRTWLQGEVLSTQLAYWREELADVPTVIDLPLDKPRPPVQTYNGAHYSVDLSPDLSAQLRELSRHHDSTLFMTLLAAFDLLLCRYAGQEQVLVGTPIANRNRSETEGLIGFFVNTLVLRGDVRGNPSFDELLRRVREVALGAYAHQDLPFELLVEELQSPRDLSYNPLFQVMFSWVEAKWSELALAGLEVSAVTLENHTSQFDIILLVGEMAGGQLRCLMRYNTALFEASSIRRMLGHYEELLRSVVQEPQQRVSRLALLSTGERQQLREWNETVAYETVATLGELFERQVERDAQAVAVVSGERKVTYGELNERANRVARYLSELGVGAETRVGLLLERGIEMVVGLLATIKAGAAYVPLDASYSQAQLEYMLADAGVMVVLTERRLQRLAGEVAASVGTVLSLDEPWAKVGSAANLATAVDSENLACIIYTSGSTDEPKGVMVTHGNVLRLFAATQDYFAFNERDVWTLYHSYAFDFSVWEMWGALLYGGRLVIVPYWASRSPESFYELLCRERVTVLNQTPSAFRQLSQIDKRAARDVQQGLALRLVIFGGEALDFESLSQWFRDHGDEQPELVNMYGITETTVHVTQRRVRVDDLAANTGSLIGRPIGDLCGYVLDQHMELLPMGVPGELYVGGPGIARGYLGRPELTAERFVPDSFSGMQGTRLYRTGDLVRYRAQGELEYLGRVDQQVKLHGLRIELGEIEAALARHPAVQDAVVMVREYGPGDQRLVAYLIPREQSEQAPAVWTSINEVKKDIERYLRERLPSYMLPSRFVFVDKWPTTLSGKVNRQALPQPKQERSERRNFDAPRNEVERTLAEIWASVLLIKKVGIHEDFFALGGDSILSIKIVARANQAGLKLSPKHIFSHRTIAELSEIAAPSAAFASAPQGLATGEIPLTPIQRAFFEQQLAEQHHFNQSVLLEVKRPLTAQQLQRVIEQLVLHHDALRLRFKRNDVSGEWEQFYAGAEAAQQVRVEEIDLRGIVANEVEAVLETRATELQSGLNIEDGPLMRVALIHRPESSGQRLLVVIHHLAVDAVSWQILLDDLQRGIKQDQRGEEVGWGPKTTSYGQWSERLTEYADWPQVREELAFWSQVMREAAELPLPLDYEGAERTLSSSRSIVQHLEPDETRALLQEVPAAYHTQINDALLTALVEAIGRWSGERRVVIEMEGHGREEISDDMDLSRTVGWFTSLYPVVLDITGAATSGAALKRVKNQLRRIPGRGIGYGVLCYLSNEKEIREQLQGAGPVELSFNYLGQLDQVLDKDSLFAGTGEPTGPQRSERGRQRYALEVTVAVMQGKLRVCFTYNEQLHAAATIQGVSNGYMKALRELVEHCQSPEAGGFTPSDFPLTDLNQAELNIALSEIE